MTALAIDLFCGLGGWTEGLIAEGYYVIGFDIERHRYPERILPDNDGVKKPGGIMRPDDPNYANRGPLDNQFAHANEARLRDAPLTGRWMEYPAQLVIQDVLTLHGSQFKTADLIVASPPCQAYSYRAMPWKRAKALPPPDNSLFEACFRIQREACEAAGRHIPMVVENVRGAQKWVGRARWNYGSFYLWGDVPALMPPTRSQRVPVAPSKHRGDGSHLANIVTGDGIKGAHGTSGSHWTNPAERKIEGIKQGGTWWHDPGSVSRISGSGSPARKAASAMIAKIPLPLARHVAAVFKPRSIAA